MSTKLILATLSLKQLGHLVGFLDGSNELKKLPSKAVGVEKAANWLDNLNKRLVATEEEGGYEVVDRPEGFQKATKDELGVMSAVERAAYRKARRKAARDTRKAK